MSFSRIVEISSESTKGFADAFQQALAQAETSLQGIRSVWISAQNVVIENGKPDLFRIRMKASSIIE